MNSAPEKHDWVSNDPLPSGNRRKKVAVFLAVLSLGFLLFFFFGKRLNLEFLAEREALLRSFQSDHPWLVFGAAFFVYVVVAGLSLPGAVVLSMVYGWYFGFPKALLLVSFASTTGATVAFLLGRYLLRDAYKQRFGDRLKSFHQALERDGPFFLFTLRMIPAIPFFMINGLMGLTPIRTWTFWWVSQIGMLPGTAVFVFAGSRVPSLQVLAEQGVAAVFSLSQLRQFAFAFALVGLFPLIIRYLMNRIAPQNSSPMP